MKRSEMVTKIAEWIHDFEKGSHVECDVYDPFLRQLASELLSVVEKAGMKPPFLKKYSSMGKTSSNCRCF